ncbi:glycosyltransferase family 2 protein [Puerhibacterium puerhi]|uniref:glycosyltransferase family 2 protein n=1 Tax=Puerhibacterium puerhi TaxID=2692623 RepID=UPI001916A00F|nr:glycosyltransferase [Puerhibacterium puerhi]
MTQQDTAPQDTARQDTAAPEVEDPRVSVVVMSRDRRDDLAASMLRHRAPVVFVDNASADGSPEVVRRVRPDARVVRLRENVGAVARNVGVREAATPYVAFADDDSWWAPGALAAAADLLEANPRVAVVQARILVGPQEREDSFMAVLRDSPLEQGELPGPRLLGFVACGAVVRRTDFLAAGGFDPAVPFPGEEEPLTLRLAALGRAVVYADHLVAHHHPATSRHSPDARRRAVARSTLTSALLLRPWRVVGARLRASLRAGGTADLAAALPTARQAVSALRRRRRLPEAVERDLRVVGQG